MIDNHTCTCTCTCTCIYCYSTKQWGVMIDHPGQGLTWETMIHVIKLQTRVCNQQRREGGDKLYGGPRPDNNMQVPYGRKLSRDPIFVEGPSSKILRSNFHGRTFQGCSTHNIYPSDSNLVGISRQAINRSYLYLAEIEKWHESSIWSRLETFVQKKLNNNELMWNKPARLDQSSWACSGMHHDGHAPRYRACARAFRLFISRI